MISSSGCPAAAATADAADSDSSDDFVGFAPPSTSGVGGMSIAVDSGGCICSLDVGLAFVVLSLIAAASEAAAAAAIMTAAGADATFVGGIVGNASC